MLFSFLGFASDRKQHLGSSFVDWSETNSFSSMLYFPWLNICCEINTIDGINIHEIYNWAYLGNEEWCAEYEGPNVGNEDIEIQYGYTGTRSHGMVIDFARVEIKNIQINNIESYNGEANEFTISIQMNVLIST